MNPLSPSFALSPSLLRVSFFQKVWPLFDVNTSFALFRKEESERERGKEKSACYRPFARPRRSGIILEGFQLKGDWLDPRLS
jgi:hypothetical protein